MSNNRQKDTLLYIGLYDIGNSYINLSDKSGMEYRIHK